MNNSRFRSLIWIPSYAIGICSEIPRSEWSILSLFSKSNRKLQNKFFVSFRCSNIYVLPMKKWRMTNIAWFHENAEKHDWFFGVPYFFLTKNTWKGHPPPQAAGAQRSFLQKWWCTGPHGKLLNVFVFRIRKTAIVSHRADFFDFFYMRSNKITHFRWLGPMHLYGRGCKTFNLLKPSCLSVHSSVHNTLVYGLARA